LLMLCQYDKITIIISVTLIFHVEFKGFMILVFCFLLTIQLHNILFVNEILQRFKPTI